ncbi:MAG TPA: VOC family protein [Acidimicrobiales bacterium]|jgi:predicted enzyme related to lactoylglutathione lyase|nr:VOC family protein [Acidimicrobiales bacterium]
MPVQLNTVLYPVKDIDRAKALYAALFGTDPHVDSSFYVGFSVNGAEIGLLPDGPNQGLTGPVPFYDVDDISATLGALQAAGAKVAQEPTDVGAGLLVARVVDADGNDIGLRQPTAGA